MSNTDKLFKEPNNLAQLFVFCGKSGKGKSYMIRYLLSDMLQKKKVKFGLVFTRTKFNNDYDFLPDDKVMQYDKEIVQNYVHNLEEMKKKNKKVQPNFMVFDDCQGILSSQTPFMQNFFATFRHFNINIFIACQYLTGRNSISPIMREQTNYCLMFKSKTRRTLENLYESYGQLFDSLELFTQYFFKATQEPFSCMVYFEREDDVDKNYITIMAPKNIPKLAFKF